MNWTKASAIAEILSSVAIVITLVYLAVEIQQNTAVLQANSRDALVEAEFQHLYKLVDDPELWLSYSRPTISESEKVRLYHFLAAMLRHSERAWLQYQSGALDQTTWLAYRGPVLSTLSYPRTRRWWQGITQQPVYDPEFIADVNAALAQFPLISAEDTLSVFDD